MSLDMEEALEYYRSQGAPSDQQALISLLKEIQQEGGGISVSAVADISRAYGVKESFIMAIIKRIPSLKLNDRHCLEICCGPSCSARARLLDFIEKNYGRKPEGFEIKTTGCMRMCAKGPNIKWDGRVYNSADEALLKKLIENS